MDREVDDPAETMEKSGAHEVHSHLHGQVVAAWTFADSPSHMPLLAFL